MDNLVRWGIVDREILRTLFEKDDAVDVYKFYQKYNLLPTKILTSIRRLQEIDVVVFDAETLSVSLTNSGRYWVVANRREIFMQKIDLSWKAPPASYVREKRDTTEPYVPKRRYISRNFFESLVPKA
jgi:hypothetical protein